MASLLTTVDRYVLGRLLRSFVPTCLGLCLLFFVAAAFRLLREPDLSLAQVALALPWLVPFLLPYLIPLAYVTTLTLVYGRMVADNEVLAFGSLGIPSRSLAWPAVLLAGLLSLGTTWLTAQVVPFAHQGKAEAKNAVFQSLLDLGEGEHFSQVFPKDGFDLYVRRYRPGLIEGVVIHYQLRLRERMVPAQLVAERGRIERAEGAGGLVLHLEDVLATLTPGVAPELIPRPQAEVAPVTTGDGASLKDELTAAAKRGTLRLHLERYVLEVGKAGRRRSKAEDHTSADLRAILAEQRARVSLAAAVGGAVATLQGRDERDVEYGSELAMRQALAAAPLLLTLLVVPLTFLLRARSPLVPFGVGLIAASALFFAPLLLGRSMAEALAAPSLVFLGLAATLLGAALAWRVASRQ